MSGAKKPAGTDRPKLGSASTVQYRFKTTTMAAATPAINLVVDEVDEETFRASGEIPPPPSDLQATMDKIRDSVVARMIKAYENQLKNQRPTVSFQEPETTPLYKPQPKSPK